MRFVAGGDIDWGIWSIAPAVLIRNRLDLHACACGVRPRKSIETFNAVDDLKIPPQMSIVPI
jgi:hypothetical protein